MYGMKNAHTIHLKLSGDYNPAQECTNAVITFSSDDCLSGSLPGVQISPFMTLIPHFLLLMTS